ncbi:NPR1 [Branchiostoma lanceolatum]|uniref:Guanylate cyclase n=1 Tax=Branchiostoma lanceolatum TaxID=7740 RepID=A0A8K0E8R6_BRALA|nr:NPR1 [Branchiostoma lanceolatum]
MASWKAAITTTAFLLVLGGGKSEEYRVLIMMTTTRHDADGDVELYFSAKRMAAGAIMAIDAVNNDPNLLSGHVLKYTYVDTECDPVQGTGQALENIFNGSYSGFIGPTCSQVCRPVANLAAYWNLPVFTPLCNAISMHDKDHFSTLVRFFGPAITWGSFYVGICRRFGWNRFAVVSHWDIGWTIPANGIVEYSEELNMTVSSYHVLSQDDSLENVLTQATRHARIILLSGPGALIRRLMLIAHDLGLTGGDHVFFCLRYFRHDEIFGNFSWRTGDSRHADAREAFKSLFVLSLYRPGNDVSRTFSRDVRRRSRETFSYEFHPDEEVSVMAAIAYDTVHIYAHALNETLAFGEDPYDGRRLAERVRNRTFEGVQGWVTLDANGDRETNYMMYSFQDGHMKAVGYYFGHSGEYEDVPGTTIRWPGGGLTPPPDMPYCGFDEEKCPFDLRHSRYGPIYTLGLALILPVIFLLVGYTIYHRHTMEKKLAFKSCQLRSQDIIPIRTSSTSSKNSLSAGLSVGQENSSCRLAEYKNTVYVMKELRVDGNRATMKRGTQKELTQLCELNHPNLARIVGACLEAPNCCVLIDHCSKGSLQDILKNASIKLDWTFRWSLIMDIVKGMEYLHNSFLKCHGSLKSTNCVVDSRFVVKITDFGLWRLRKKRRISLEEPKFDALHLNNNAVTLLKYAQDQLWMAPEVLRGGTERSQKADVYSFALILHEIAFRRGVFYQEGSQLSPKDIITRVALSLSGVPFRPTILEEDCPTGLSSLMKQCWAETPEERPDCKVIGAVVRRISGMKSENILDNLLARMEHYADNLESLVQEKTAQVLDEKKRAEDLLERLLPRTVANQLKHGGTVLPETYDSVTVFFSDIVGFTAMSAASSPMEVVDMLNDLYTCFDDIIGHYDVYKVETIGDAYVVVSGLPERNSNHAAEIARMSLEMLKAVQTFRIRHRTSEQLKLRIGIHTGPCAAGVVGRKMPRYCLFGDTVNTASRMETYGMALRIHVSETTYQALCQTERFQLESRGEMDIKGKGPLRTYWLLGEKDGIVQESFV